MDGNRWHPHGDRGLNANHWRINEGKYFMNLGLLTCIWGRPRLTELVLRHYDQVDLCNRMLAFSRLDDLAALDNAGYWDTVCHSNEPLSGKWNAGMKAFYDLDEPLDGVMIVGSDDLVTPSYIDAAKYLLERGADYIFLPSLYFYNLQDGRMHYCLAERLGLGRVLSRRLLDMLDWKPWPDGLNKGLDGAMWEKIKDLKEVNIVKLDLQTCKKLGIAAMDIKGSDNNLWGYDESVYSLMCSEVKDPASVLDKHFSSVKDELLNWKHHDIVG